MSDESYFADGEQPEELEERVSCSGNTPRQAALK
jgi:hypothetical protein